MPWLKLDDAIDGHEKVAPLGPLGFALHIKALLYAARNLTDGFVPAAKARTLVDLSGVKVAGDDPDGRGSLEPGGARYGTPDVGELIAVLVDAGLWEIDRERRGYVLHDFLDFNPPAAEVKAEREKAAARMRELRARRRSERSSAERSPEQDPNNGRSSATPEPGPDPERDDLEVDHPPSSPPERNPEVGSRASAGEEGLR